VSTDVQIQNSNRFLHFSFTSFMPCASSKLKTSPNVQHGITVLRKF